MKNPDIEALRSTLRLVDNVSNDSFGRIKSLCAVALLAMEQHRKPVDMEHLARILVHIEVVCDDARNCINYEAETVGCDYKDEAWLRRIDARAAWREAARAGGVPHD